MADEIDCQLERDEVLEAERLKKIRVQAAKIPKGEPGDCNLCGEWSARLVNGVCAPCRDRRKLP
jgi:hypothetical protein